MIKRGYVVTGRVTERAGRAVEGAQVRELHNFGYRKLSTQTDANGEFVLLGLADTSGQTVELVAQAAGLGPQIQIVRLLQPTNTAEFVLAPGNVFRGRVVDDAGQPIAQAAVRTDFDFEKQIPDRFEWLTNTDAQGRFEWNSAPAERVCFWFEADGYEVIRSHSFLADGTDHETFAGFWKGIESAGLVDWADYDPHSATHPGIFYRRKHNPWANWVAKVLTCRPTR